MIVQFNKYSISSSQYKFADPEMIVLYEEIFGLERYHTLIRETI